MSNTINTRLTTTTVPIKSWFREIHGINKTAIIGGFGPFINSMIIVNGTRKLMEHKDHSKG